MSTAYDQNRNAVIVTRIDRTGKTRTETQRRDPYSAALAVSTDPRTNATNLFIDLPYTTAQLTGREARTLYRLLQKHYRRTNKTTFEW